jgi:hypothetical protein
VLLRKWLTDAITFAAIQRDAVIDLEKGQPDETVCQWKDMKTDWEADHDKPDPFYEPERCK